MANSDYKNDKAKLLDAISHAKKIMITSHINPDVDAVCSCIAIYWILKTLKKDNVDIVLEDDEMPLGPKFIEGIDRIKHEPLNKVIGDYDLIFFMDSNAVKRFSRFPFEVAADTRTARIDHHATDADINIDFNFVDAGCSSTSEMIYRLFNEEIDFSASVAKALLAGIFADSQAFTTKEVTKQTFCMIAELITKGAKLAEISAELKQYDETVLNTVKVLINNLRFDDKYKYAYTYISRSVYEFLGLDGVKMDSAMDRFIDILLGRVGYSWGFLVRPDEKTTTKVSLRARANTQNVRRIAESLGGGGHDEAAGATLEDVSDPYEALAKVRNKIEEMGR